MNSNPCPGDLFFSSAGVHVLVSMNGPSLRCQLLSFFKEKIIWNFIWKKKEENEMQIRKEWIALEKTLEPLEEGVWWQSVEGCRCDSSLLYSKLTFGVTFIYKIQVISDWLQHPDSLGFFSLLRISTDFSVCLASSFFEFPASTDAANSMSWNVLGC